MAGLASWAEPASRRRARRSSPPTTYLSVIDSVYLPLLLDRPVTFPAKAEYFTARGPVGRAWAACLRSTSQLSIDRDDPRTRQMLPPGSRIPRPHRIEVRLGEPMTFDDVSDLPPARARPRSPTR
jgi:hypothetical protein